MEESDFIPLASTGSLTELHPFWLSLYLYHVFPYVPYSSTLKIEATGLLKMLVHFYQTVQLYIPEYSFLIVFLFTILVVYTVLTFCQCLIGQIFHQLNLCYSCYL